MSYVSPAEVRAAIPIAQRPDIETVTDYVTDAEEIAKVKIGDPLPVGNALLASAIKDWAIAKTFERSNIGQSRDLYASARQLRQDAEDSMDAIDAQENRDEEKPDTHTVVMEDAPF